MSTLIPLRPVSNRAASLSLRNRVEIQGDFCIKVKQKFLNMNKQKKNTEFTGNWLQKYTIKKERM